MKKVVQTRFKELLARKERLEHRRISRRMVAEETGISLSSVQSWADGSLRRFDEAQIVAFCTYFQCKDVGELLVLGEIEVGEKLAALPLPA